jgi:hypothetical protein
MSPSNGKWAFSNSLRVLFKIIVPHKQEFFLEVKPAASGGPM